MNKRKKSLGVVVVNYNAGEMLNNCLNSVFREHNPELIDLKVIVVDNASNDESLNLDEIDNKKLIIIRNLINKGFGTACNQGVKAFGEVDYILFLNPDTLVNTTTFEKSISFLEENDNVSIMGTMHKDENGKVKASCSRRPTFKRVLSDILGLSKILPKIFKPATVMSDFDHEKSRFVDQVMGAYMFMKKQVFEDINGFDESFFVYYEDADFALRALNKGHMSYYNSDIQIIHHGRGTTAKISDISLFYNLRSRVQFVKKHYGRLNGFIIQVLTFVVEPFTRIGYNLIKNPKENKNTIKAFIKLYRDQF